jgi:hypothetical protein
MIKASSRCRPRQPRLGSLIVDVIVIIQNSAVRYSESGNSESHQRCYTQVAVLSFLFLQLSFSSTFSLVDFRLLNVCPVLVPDGVREASVDEETIAEHIIVQLT